MTTAMAVKTKGIWGHKEGEVGRGACRTQEKS